LLSLRTFGERWYVANMRFALSMCIAITISACLTTDDSALPPPPPIPGDSGVSLLQDPVLVLRVVDGDTIVIERNGVEDRIRLKGIDTPELFASPPEPFSDEARIYVNNNVGTRIDLQFDSGCPEPPEELCRDSQPVPRLLTYVRLANGSDLGARLLEVGLAKVYVFNNEDFDRKQQYLSLEAEAKSNRVGQWQ